MSLVLTIVRQPQGANVAKTRMSFGAAGGTIGRNAGNDWQLPDPDRFVSSRHASIRCEDGQYYLVDTSTNGVYYNNTAQPLGTGNQAVLSQGDRLYFGEYELLVEFEQSPAADNMSLNAFDQWLDPEPTGDVLVGNADGSVGNDFLVETEELDPLAALDKVSPSSSMPSSNTIPDDDDWLGTSQPDNARATEQAFSIPKAVSDPVVPEKEEKIAPPAFEQAVDQAIPDDWDIDDLLGDDGISDELASPLIPQPQADLQSSPATIPESFPESIPEPIPAPIPTSVPAPIPEVKEDLMAMPETAKDRGAELDEIESLLTDDRNVSEVQQDLADSAQRETDELDAFLGLDDTPVPTVTPSPGGSVVPPPAKPIVEAVDLELQQEGWEPEVDARSGAASANMDPEPFAQQAPEAGASAMATQIEDLIVALGLDPEQIGPEQKAHFNTLVAELMRESTKGLMAVLGARNAIKNEFRMNVTLIQAAENNPLKFSPNVDEALRNMFVSQSNAYLPAVLAVRHGFQDIADHQISVIAGMREAFNSMMKQFDPKKLADRFDKQQNRRGLIKGKSAKYWESYAEYYQGLANNMDDSFQDLFGEEFAEAYEQQMNILSASRKK